MKSIDNPFSPGAGSQPPELVGREDIVEAANVCISRLKRGRAARGFLLVGLRGVGKTVMLNRILQLTRDNNCHAELIEANDDASLGQIVLPALRKMILELDYGKAAGAHLKRAANAFRNFIGIFHVTIEGIKFGLDAKPENGVADSGDLESDFSDLLISIAEAAKERDTAAMLIIDEMQYLKPKELNALVVACHRISQLNLPFFVVGAGLPPLLGILGKTKSYAERLFDYPRIGALSTGDAGRAVELPLQAAGVQIEPDALSEIVQVTKGYPYFLQEWGHHVWNAAPRSPITLAIVRAAHQNVLEKLDQSFFRVRFDRLTTNEKDYLRTMAELSSSTMRSKDIAAVFGKKPGALTPIRSSLIKKGMIYSPIHGETAFTVPLFGEFLIRVMPWHELSRRIGSRKEPNVIGDLLK